MSLKLQTKWLVTINLFPLYQLLQRLRQNRELDIVKRFCSNCTNQSFMSLSDITSINPLKLIGARKYNTSMGYILFHCLQFTAPNRAFVHNDKRNRGIRCEQCETSWQLPRTKKFLEAAKKRLTTYQRMEVCLSSSRPNEFARDDVKDSIKTRNDLLNENGFHLCE